MKRRALPGSSRLWRLFVGFAAVYGLVVITTNLVLPDAGGSESSFSTNDIREGLRPGMPIRSSSTASTNDDTDTPRLVVVAPTFYETTSETRYRLGLEACRTAAEYGIEFILIDASPSQAIRDGLERAGRRSTDGRSFVTVVRQESKGKKGAALREGIARAVDRLLDEHEHDTTNNHNNNNNNHRKSTKKLIGFQELEKVDVVRQWNAIAVSAKESNADIVVPRREDEQFRASYPIEQYHSERFINMLLDSLGKKIGFPSIDWLNGPVVFDISMADAWLEHDGELWDAQIIPIVDCFVNRNAKITSFDIPYVHPPTMKEQEEGNLAFIEKRLYQINFLTATLGKRMKEAVAAAAANQ